MATKNVFTESYHLLAGKVEKNRMLGDRREDEGRFLKTEATKCGTN